MAIKHAKISAVEDGADETLVRPSDWNADHTGTNTHDHSDAANGGTVVVATSAELDTGTNNTKMATALAIAGRVDNTGWIPARQSWTYASATTITVPSGAASIYSVGDKIRLKQGGGYKYYYVIVVADTLLTVTGGSDYTVADAAITDIYYSKASTPIGFPGWLNYTPTGVAETNVVLSGRFTVTGRLCCVSMKCAFSGAITYTSHPTLPIPASANMIMYTYSAVGVGDVYDQSTAIMMGALFPRVVANATTVIPYNSVGASISASVPVTWANLDYFSLWFSYEI